MLTCEANRYKRLSGDREVAEALTLGWLYVGLMVVATAVNSFCVFHWNRVLIRRRAGLRLKGTKRWDLALLIFLLSPAMLAVFVVAVVEARAVGWGTPGTAWLAGLLLFVFAWTLITWSMVVNPFFEKVVRIQTDHNHRVVDSGPYAYARHPGYVGFSVWILSTPLLLGSRWAFIPAVLTVVALVIRTALEDRTLRAELDGYAEYANRVRFRLFPGIW